MLYVCNYVQIKYRRRVYIRRVRAAEGPAGRRRRTGARVGSPGAVGSAAREFVCAAFNCRQRRARPFAVRTGKISRSWPGEQYSENRRIARPKTETRNREIRANSFGRNRTRRRRVYWLLIDIENTPPTGAFRVNRRFSDSYRPRPTLKIKRFPEFASRELFELTACSVS